MNEERSGREWRRGVVYGRREQREKYGGKRNNKRRVWGEKEKRGRYRRVGGGIRKEGNE